MVLTQTTGKSPLAVSPDNITQSAPSKMAFATSLASALVGLGFFTMDSNIWVAQMTGIAKPVALRDHLLLGDEDLLSGDLNSHVASGHHAALPLLDDLGKVLDSLLVLDLGDNQDLLPLLPEDVFDLPDPVGIPDEGSEDHVDTLLNSKQQIRFVLLGDGGKVGVCSRQVAVEQGVDMIFA